MNLPTSRQQALEWFETRLATWTTNAAGIGLTAAQMTAFATLIGTNRKDFNDAQTARAAAKAATLKFYNSSNLMRDPGRGYIAAIKAFAETSRNPAVYALGMIDPPAPPTPVPAPAAPTDVTGTVSPTGQITISWKAAVSGASSGIFFMIQRQRSGETAYTLLGGTQEKSFFDPAPNVIAGPVSYKLRAQRSSDASAWTVPIVFDLAAGQGMMQVTQMAQQADATTEKPAGYVGGTGENGRQAA